MKLTGHHGYLIEGFFNDVKDPLFSKIEKELDIVVEGNLDLWVREFALFDIESAKVLREENYKKSAGKVKIFIISFGKITVEAQNTLLKVFEEPTSSSVFFLITANVKSVLPTLLSRLFKLEIKKENSAVSESSKDFISSSFQNRLKLLKDIIEEKDVSEVIRLLNDIEIILTKEEQTDRAIFDQIYKSKRHIVSRGASFKLILENLSLILPVVKAKQKA